MRKLLSLLVLSVVPLLAYRGCPTDCQWECTLQSSWGGNFEAGLHAIYWRSTQGGDEIWRFQAGTSSRTDEVFELSPGYNWGGRAFLALTDCDYSTFAMAEYGWYYSSQLTDVAPEAGETLSFEHLEGLPTLTEEEAFAKLQYNYQWLDLLVGRAWRWGCNALYGFGGARGLYYWQRERTEVFGMDGDDPFEAFSFTKNRLPSVGVLAGIGGEYWVSSGVSLKGRLGGLAMIGPRRTRFRTAQGTNDFELFLPTHYVVVPGLDLQTSVAFTYTCFCFGFVGEIGYQMHHYFNAIRNVSGTEQGTFALQEDAGFAGPYAGLSLYF